VAKGCVTCHAHAASGASKEMPSLAVGPDLTDRRLPADYLAKFLADPSVKTVWASGNRMPDLELAPLAGARVLERLVLEAVLAESDGGAVGEQRGAVGGDEVRHRRPAPDVAVQPEAAVHRVRHPVLPARELAPRDGVGLRHRWALVERAPRDLHLAHRRPVGHWQATTPSLVAGATAAAEP
jgi:hypothetical protein